MTPTEPGDCRTSRFRGYGEEKRTAPPTPTEGLPDIRSPTVTKPDPITIEILRNAFIMAAEEMNAALIRSAYTPVIYESKDCAVALIDSRHRVLGQSSGVPLFLGNLEACTLATEEMFGRSVWAQATSGS